MEVYPLKRLLVSLDLTSHDKALLKYISKISQILNPDVIYFLHVANDLELPEEIAKNYPGLMAPVDETLEKSIEFEIENKAEIDQSVKTEILIREGKTAEQVLKTVKQKEIDLLVLGRKNNKQANLTIVKKIVRAAPCSVAMIPEHIPEKLDKILVPIDFSDSSVLSLKRVEFMQSQFKDMQIIALNAYEVPQGYSKTGKSFKEFDEIMRENAKKEARKFVEKHKFDLKNLDFEFACTNKIDLHVIINEYAVSHGVNAILIGSKGRNAFSNFILGSITESVIEHDQYLPVIVMKNKREGMSVMEALFEL